MEKRLLRSRDRVIAGVCGGLASYIGMDPTLLRLVFAVVTLATGGVFAVVYLLLWAIMPEEKAGVAPRPMPVEAPPLEDTEQISSTPAGTPEAEGATPAEPTATPQPRRRDTRVLGWILVGIGAFFLLRSLGLGELIGYLWPMVLIGVGLTLLWPYLRNR